MYYLDRGRLLPAHLKDTHQQFTLKAVILKLIPLGCGHILLERRNLNYFSRKMIIIICHLYQLTTYCGFHSCVFRWKLQALLPVISKPKSNCPQKHIYISPHSVLFHAKCGQYERSSLNVPDTATALGYTASFLGHNRCFSWLCWGSKWPWLEGHGLRLSVLFGHCHDWSRDLCSRCSHC